MCTIFRARQIKNFFFFIPTLTQYTFGKKKVRTGKKGPPSDLAVTSANISWFLNPGLYGICSQSEIVCFLILGWCPDFLVCSATRSCVAKDPV